MKKEKTIVENELYAEFKKECKVLSLVKEYPGYVGYEKYMILTGLSKEELSKKYGVLLKNYEPYVLGSMQLYSPISDYEKNEDKFEKRNARNTISIEVDSDDEQTFSSLQVEDDLLMSVVKSDDEELYDRVWKALRKLPEVQRRRLIKWAIEGKTLLEIAKDEGVSKQMVCKSVQAAKENFKKYFGERLTFGTPLSKEDEGIIDDGE